MPDIESQAHDFIRRSLEAYLVFLGPDKKPIVPDRQNYQAVSGPVHAGFHHAIDALQKESPREDRLSASPDQLAKDILGQLDKQHVKYKIDPRDKILTIYGFGGMRGEWKYSATLPIDKWATYVSGGLAVLGASDAPGNPPTPSQIPVLGKAPEPLAVRVNPVDGLEYTWIPAGQFRMGALPGDMNARHEEVPRHEVRITHGFWLSRGPVTVSAYQSFARELRLQMPGPPHYNPGWINHGHPVVRVTWHDAVAYSQWTGGRLPSEAEWEYAARGGTDGCYFPWGNDISPDQANYSDGKIGGTSAVGRYPPNGFGLYDIAGNVSEWCSDWFNEDYYLELSRPGIAEDPRGPTSGTVRVLRGGSWCYSSRYLRCSYRLWFEPDDHDYDIGFRCVRDDMP